MTEISRSPERHTFQKEKYIERCRKEGREPSEDYLAMFEETIEQENNKWVNPDKKENNLEYDLLTTAWILDKVRTSDSYAQNLYAAMCNNDFQKLDTWPILTDQKWSCSWRYAGGIIADMRRQGDYIEWYCSGIRDRDAPTDEEQEKWNEEQKLKWETVFKNYVSESHVTDEIREDLQRLGWAVIDDSSNDNE